MRCESDQTIDDQLGRRLLEVVQMLVAEHQRQLADGEVDEAQSQPLRQDLFIQPHPTREAA